MADKEIGDLTVATTPLDGTELVEIVQGGNSRQTTVADLAPDIDAADVPYDNSTSLLSSTDVQAAIDELALAATAADGDKGDVTVSGGGTTWTIDNDVVTNAKSANMAQSTIKGRAASAGTGDPTDLSATQVVAIIGDTDGTLAANSDAIVATQKATRTYVDAKVAGLSWKQAVRVATTVAGTLASSFENGDTVDGVALATGDRILIKNQSSGSENGIYVVAASGAPARSTDADSGAELVNASVYVSEGTTLADTQWTCTTNATITVGSTALVFAQLTSGGGFTTASTTEVLTGTDTAKGVTPDALAALWEKGSDIASAGTITIGEGGYFHVTGTTGITDIDWSVAKDGRLAWLVFDGILTITHNGTTLKLPTAANITTAAGDRALFIEDASDNVICLTYIRADGTALAASGFTAASTTEVLTGTDTTKGVTSDALAALWEKGSDVASSGTISIGEGGYCHVTGTTTITDIDWATAKDGRTVWAVFDGILTLTHNATTLKLPTGANIITAAGDRALFVQDASDNVICLVYVRADGTALAGSSATGKQTIWVPAGAMISRTTNGPSTGTVELSSNKNMVVTLDFDATTQEFAQFDVAMPKGFNNSTVTFVPYWSHPATTTNFGVVWGVDAVAISDDDALDVAFGTAQTVVDTGGTTNDLYVGSESSAITIAGTPATSDLVQYRIHRDPANGSDTMAVDARLHGVKVIYTSAATDD